MQKCKIPLFQDMDNVCVLLKKEFVQGRHKLFHQVNLNNTLHEALKDKHIVEFPVFQVVLKQNLSQFQLVPALVSEI